jgi:hypothetical protein
MNDAQRARKKELLEATINHPASTPEEVEQARQKLARLTTPATDHIEVLPDPRPVHKQSTASDEDKPKRDPLKEQSEHDFEEWKHLPGFPEDTTLQDVITYNLLGGCPMLPRVQALADWRERFHEKGTADVKD